MRALATCGEFDSPEFIARLGGLYRHCETLAHSVQTLCENTASRVRAMRRNAYMGLAELGEELFRVQEARPGEFKDWFAAHKSRLGFSLRTAERCKTAAKLIRDHGPEQALAIALGETSLQRPEPFIALSLRLPVAPAQIPDEDLAKWLERFRPAAEVYRELEARAHAMGEAA